MAIRAPNDFSINKNGKSVRPNFDDSLPEQLENELLEALGAGRKKLRAMINACFTVAACRHPATDAPRLID
jgi:hypothetical protein